MDRNKVTGYENQYKSKANLYAKQHGYQKALKNSNLARKDYGYPSRTHTEFKRGLALAGIIAGGVISVVATGGLAAAVFVAGAGATQIGMSEYADYSHNKSREKKRIAVQETARELSKKSLLTLHSMIPEDGMQNMTEEQLIGLQVALADNEYVHNLSNEDYHSYEKIKQSITTEIQIKQSEKQDAETEKARIMYQDAMERLDQTNNEVRQLRKDIDKNFEKVFEAQERMTEKVIQGQKKINENIDSVHEDVKINQSLLESIGVYMKEVQAKQLTNIMNLAYDNNKMLVDLTKYFEAKDAAEMKKQDIDNIYETLSFFGVVGRACGIPSLVNLSVVGSHSFTIARSTETIFSKVSLVSEWNAMNIDISLSDLLSVTTSIASIAQAALAIYSYFKPQKKVEDVILEQIALVLNHVKALRDELKQLGVELHQHLDYVLDQVASFLEYGFRLTKDIQVSVEGLHHKLSVLTYLTQLNAHDQFLQPLMLASSQAAGYLESGRNYTLPQSDFFRLISQFEYWLGKGCRQPILTGGNLLTSIRASGLSSDQLSTLESISDVFKLVAEDPDQFSFFLNLFLNYGSGIFEDVYLHHSAVREGIDKNHIDNDNITYAMRSFSREESLRVGYLMVDDDLVSLTANKDILNDYMISQREPDARSKLLIIPFSDQGEYGFLCFDYFDQRKNVHRFATYDKKVWDFPDSIDELLSLNESGSILDDSDISTWHILDGKVDSDLNHFPKSGVMVAVAGLLQCGAEAYPLSISELESEIENQKKWLIKQESLLDDNRLNQIKRTLTVMKDLEDGVANIAVMGVSLKNFIQLKSAYPEYAYDVDNSSVMSAARYIYTTLQMIYLLQTSPLLMRLIFRRISTVVDRINRLNEDIISPIANQVYFTPLEQTIQFYSDNPVPFDRFLGNWVIRSAVNDPDTYKKAKSSHEKQLDKFIDIVRNYQTYSSLEELKNVIVGFSIAPNPVYLIAQSLGLGYFEMVIFESVRATQYGLDISMGGKGAYKYGIDTYFVAKDGQRYLVTEAQSGNPSKWDFVKHDTMHTLQGNGANLRALFNQQGPSRTKVIENKANQDAVMKLIRANLHQARRELISEFLDNVESEGYLHILYTDLMYLNALFDLIGMPKGVKNEIFGLTALSSLPKTLKAVMGMKRLSSDFSLSLPPTQLIADLGGVVERIMLQCALNPILASALYDSPIVKDIEDKLGLLQAYMLKSHYQSLGHASLVLKYPGKLFDYFNPDICEAFGFGSIHYSFVQDTADIDIESQDGDVVCIYLLDGEYHYQLYHHEIFNLLSRLQSDEYLALSSSVDINDDKINSLSSVHSSTHAESSAGPSTTQTSSRKGKEEVGHIDQDNQENVHNLISLGGPLRVFNPIYEETLTTTGVLTPYQRASVTDCIVTDIKKRLNELAISSLVDHLHSINQNYQQDDANDDQSVSHDPRPTLFYLCEMSDIEGLKEEIGENLELLSLRHPYHNASLLHLAVAKKNCTIEFLESLLEMLVDSGSILELMRLRVNAVSSQSITKYKDTYSHDVLSMYNDFNGYTPKDILKNRISVWNANYVEADGQKSLLCQKNGNPAAYHFNRNNALNHKSFFQEKTDLLNSALKKYMLKMLGIVFTKNDFVEIHTTNDGFQLDLTITQDGHKQQYSLLEFIQAKGLAQTLQGSEPVDFSRLIADDSFEATVRLSIKNESIHDVDTLLRLKNYINELMKKPSRAQDFVPTNSSHDIDLDAMYSEVDRIQESYLQQWTIPNRMPSAGLFSRREEQFDFDQDDSYGLSESLISSPSSSSGSIFSPFYRFIESRPYLSPLLYSLIGASFAIAFASLCYAFYHSISQDSKDAIVDSVNSFYDDVGSRLCENLFNITKSVVNEVRDTASESEPPETPPPTGSWW